MDTARPQHKQSRYHRHWAAGLIAFAALAMGCGMPQAPRIRFATASEAQLKAAELEDMVWYEFRRGDEVPIAFMLVGVTEGITPEAIHARATRTFYLVVRKHGPPMFSFDGEHLVEHDAGKAAITLGRTRDGTNQVGVVVFLGQEQDMPPELKRAE
jgi:hypothetical protein